MPTSLCQQVADPGLAWQCFAAVTQADFLEACCFRGEGITCLDPFHVHRPGPTDLSDAMLPLWQDFYTKSFSKGAQVQSWHHGKAILPTQKWQWTSDRC